MGLGLSRSPRHDGVVLGLFILNLLKENLFNIKRAPLYSSNYIEGHCSLCVIKSTLIGAVNCDVRWVKRFIASWIRTFSSAGMIFWD